MPAFDPRLAAAIQERLQANLVDEAYQFFEGMTHGGYSEFLLLIDLLGRMAVPWCMLGTAAVNAYVRQVGEDETGNEMYLKNMDLVVLEARRQEAAKALSFSGEPQGLTIRLVEKPDFQAFLARAEVRKVYGETVPVACLKDLFDATAEARRTAPLASDRLRHTMDLFRLAEACPEAVEWLPDDLKAQLDRSAPDDGHGRCV